MYKKGQELWELKEKFAELGGCCKNFNWSEKTYRTSRNSQRREFFK
jgi:hypothetical protein